MHTASVPAGWQGPPSPAADTLALLSLSPALSPLAQEAREDMGQGVTRTWGSLWPALVWGRQVKHGGTVRGREQTGEKGAIQLWEGRSHPPAPSICD
jgi:hypothetical protein